MSKEDSSAVSQKSLIFSETEGIPEIPGRDAFYTTDLGAAYVGDSRELLKDMPEGSVDLIVTSPPYALGHKKEYGNADKSEYVDWFMDFAHEFHRVLTDEGSFVLNIGGSYNKGEPTRSLYHYKLLIELVEEADFHLAQELFWYNPAKLPVPAEWVTVRRIRIRDSVEYVWWLSKTPWPEADNRRVLKEYSEDQKRLNEKGVDRTRRPSGHLVKDSFSSMESGGSIPPNVVEAIPESMLKFGNNAANTPYMKKTKEAEDLDRHPARFPKALPQFCIRLLTEEGDLVLDPFAGSNTTGAVAEELERRWLAIDDVEEYLEGSKFRF